MSDGAPRNGWTRVAFGDVVRLNRERSSDPGRDGLERYVGLEHIDPGDLKIRRWGEVADGTTFTNVFRPGQVLFGKRRAYLRKVALADFEGVCSGDIYVLEPRNGSLLPELLPFICQTERFLRHAIGTSDGSLSPRTNWKSLASYTLLLPPREEQRRIGKALHSLERAADCCVQLETAADKLYRSVLDAQMGGGDADCARRSDLKSRRNCSPMELGDIAAIRFSSVDKKSHSGEVGVHLCNYMDVYSRDHITCDVEFMEATATEKEIQEFKLSVGDVLITKDSETPDDIGVSALVLDDLDDVICGYHLAILRPDPELINGSFLAHYFRSTPAKTYLYRVAEGTTRYGLSLEAVRAMPVPLPRLDTQGAVAEILGACRSAIHACRRRRESYGLLKRTALRSLL